jgi:hypothetical protein
VVREGGCRPCDDAGSDIGVFAIDQAR